MNNGENERANPAYGVQPFLAVFDAIRFDQDIRIVKYPARHIEIDAVMITPISAALLAVPFETHRVYTYRIAQLGCVRDSAGTNDASLISFPPPSPYTPEPRPTPLT